MNRFSPLKHLSARTLVALAALAVAAPLQAEDAPPAAAAPSNEAMQAAKQVHGEYMELQKRLADIQKKALEAHPELKQQEQALIDLMMSKMASTSGSAKDDLAGIEKLEQTLRNPDTSEGDRQKLMTEYQQKAMAFRNAQIQALKDPEVQKTQKALMDASLAAMKEQDPQTEQLMKDMQEKQQKIQQIMGAAGHGQ